MNNYTELSIAELRALLRAKNVAGYSSMRKADMVSLLESMDSAEAAPAKPVTAETKKSAVAKTKNPDGAETKKPAVAEEKKPATAEEKPADAAEVKKAPETAQPQQKTTRVTRRVVGSTRVEPNIFSASEGKPENRGQVRPEAAENRRPAQNEGGEARAERNDGGETRRTIPQGDPTDSGIIRRGIFEICSDNYGFLRNDNYLPSEHDVYINPSMIRRYNLTTGDVVEGTLKKQSAGEKFVPLHHITKINDKDPEFAMRRRRFDRLTPVFPHERLRMEYPGCNVATRAVDLFSPIGKGQRGMIVSQPKAGKTTLLKQIARSILVNHKSVHLIILLIDERPEEVTDFKDFVKDSNAEVIYSTFDEEPNRHRRVSEMTMERAKRLVEYGEDVVILLDSITRLARAYNLTCVSSGRTLSGGLNPNALYMPKKFFGAARCMKEGGSLTILATALVETGSRMDDVIYEEFKGTGNMELVLNRDLSERRIFPAIDLPKSSTRREDLLLTEQEMRANNIMRKAFNGKSPEESIEKIINLLVRTKSNQEFMQFVVR